MTNLEIYKPIDQIKHNWAIVLDNLTFENVTKERLEVLQYGSDSWKHAPCGNLCNTISRNKYGDPVDRILKDMGYHFSDMITIMKLLWLDKDKTGFDFCRTQCIYMVKSIEKRAAELLS